MFLRTKLADDKKAGLIFGVVLILVAGAILLNQFLPHRKAKLNQAYYTTDDGQSWFAASAFQIAPFDQNGKTAVIAEIYSYDNGSKQFCAYLAKYTTDAKAKLESAIASAQAKGLPPSGVELFNDRGFINSGMMVKKPGPDHPWVRFNDPAAGEIFSIHSPDGSAVDEVFVY